MGEFFAQYFDEFGAELVLFVVFFEFETLGDAGITADGGDVDHAVSFGGVASQHSYVWQH